MGLQIVHALNAAETGLLERFWGGKKAQLEFV